MKKELKQRRKFIFAKLKEIIQSANPINAFVNFFSLLHKINKRLNPDEYKIPELADTKKSGYNINI
jgi:hypothetical protein